MRLEQLEQVIQIEKWGSFHLAAQYLHMTHQNLSRSIQSLENELGITIFFRSAKGASFTANGKLVYSFAVNVINAHKKLLKDISFSNDVSVDVTNLISQHSVKIAFTSSLDSILKPLLYNLQETYQFSSANIHERNTEECLSAVQTTFEYDIVLLQNDYKYLINHSQPAANYHLYFLTIEKLELITSKHSLFAEEKIISRTQLETIPLISFTHDNKPSNVAQVCIDNHIHLNIVSYANTLSIIQELLLSGTVNTIGVPSSQIVIKTNPVTRDNLVSIPIEIPLRIATAVYLKKEFCETTMGENFLSVMKQAYCKTIEQVF